MSTEPRLDINAQIWCIHYKRLNATELNLKWKKEILSSPISRKKEERERELIAKKIEMNRDG